MDEKKKDLLRRYLVVVLAHYLMALGIELTVLSGTGTTPLSTIPLVLSLNFTNLSMGTWTFLWNLVLIGTQFFMMRHHFHLKELLQLPLMFLLSVCIDLNAWLLSWLHPESLWVRILLLVLGSLILAFAIELEVASNVVINCGEAIVDVFAKKAKLPFSTMKIILDLVYVVIGIFLSFLFFGGINGVGLGTIYLGICTGLIIRFFDKLLRKTRLTKYLF